MTHIHFTIPAVPVAQPRQRHRVVEVEGRKPFSRNYTPKKDPIHAFKDEVRLAATRAYKGAPIEGPVWVQLVFVMPRPQNLVWKRKAMPRIWHTGDKDFDNLAKGVADALSKLLYLDDKQIADCRIRKFYASGYEDPHVEVTVRSLDMELLEEPVLAAYVPCCQEKP